eukprot:TRINITY_DN3889_c0_g1_i2.p1 TRINITY_DN3889_c0_g1~~TRINITY_DN3889_c0_g1_i2.p1  ORF type:complete len:1032 (-),score=220.04 TRINITY_DN3889_c0_g1_i2:393-3488(-)
MQQRIIYAQPTGGEQRVPRMSAQLRAISIEYTYNELMQATMNWHSSRKLGSGTYGAVYKGELEDGSEVAIKVIDLKALAGHGTSAEMSGFEEEVTMLSKFRHPNLVTLLGWGKQDTHNTSYRYLVYELLAGGDAFQRLQKSKVRSANGMPFHWYERLSVCLDAATGLSHMHNSKPKAFHRDIKSANILLDRHGTAKMADFGLSCTSARTGALHVTVKNISGTPGYACPLYSRTGRVTEGSEVYSTGMVYLELLTGLAPATADPTRPGGIAYPVGEVIQPNHPGALERCMGNIDASAGWPLPLAQEFGKMAIRCLHIPDESQRPRFVDLVRSVRDMMNRYPKPSQPHPGAFPAAVPAGVHAAQQAGYPGAAAVRPAAQQVQRAGSFSSGQPVARLASGAGGVSAQAARPTAPSGVDFEGPFFALELVRAVGVELEELPSDRRRMALQSLGSAAADVPAGAASASIGRQHQPEFFEVWLPDASLRNSISRAAFEIVFQPGSGFKLVVRGGNPVAVDGTVVAKNVEVALRLGSEVGFTYASSGEVGVFLLLRFGKTLPPGASAQGAAMATAQAPLAPPPSAKAAAQPSSPGDGPARRVSEAQSQISSVADAAKPAGPPRGRLDCVVAEGLTADQLNALPAEVKTLPLTGSSTVVGRQHQSRLFEELLTNMPQNLSFISRSHVQVEVNQEGKFVVSNMSSNPLYVDKESVPKGGARTVTLDSTISFARLEQSAKMHVHFLVFKLSGPSASPAPAVREQPQRAAEQQPATPSPVSNGGPGSFAAAPAQAVARTPASASTPVGGSPPGAGFSSPEGSASPASEVVERPNPERNVRKETIELNPQRMAALISEAQSGSCEDEVVLELHGEGVLPVPLADRRIGPMSVVSEPLVVGRRHQVELHKRAISKECLQFLSRDHFQIFVEGGEFKLEALTSNPIWRDRPGAEAIELARNDIVGLVFNDRIALGTGGDAATVTMEDARSRLCWTFLPARNAGGGEDSGPAASSYDSYAGARQRPSSPGGAGPRVSNIAPWNDRP